MAAFIFLWLPFHIINACNACHFLYAIGWMTGDAKCRLTSSVGDVPTSELLLFPLVQQIGKFQEHGRGDEIPTQGGQ